jgi:hypothetical protein
MGSTISYYIYGTTDASDNIVSQDASGNRVEDASGNVLSHDASGNRLIIGDASENVVSNDASGNRIKDASGNVVSNDASGNRIKDASGCVITRDASGNVVIQDDATTSAPVVVPTPVSVPIPIRFTPTVTSQLVPPARATTSLSVSPLNSHNIHIVRRHKGRKAH